MNIDLKELDEVIAAFGRAVTETPVQRPLRLEAENRVRDFLLALRKRLHEPPGYTQYTNFRP